MADESFSGWKNWDTWAVYLWATNDEQFMRSKHEPWLKNIKNKMKKGVYDRKQMIPAIKKYYVPEVIKIAKKNGDDINIKKVNVEEIVEHLEQEAREY